MIENSTAIEKYRQLTKSDKDFLRSLSRENPEETLPIADRQLVLYEKGKNWTCSIAIFLTLFFVAYSFGLPKSILGFFSGILAFCFLGMMLSIMSYIFVEIVFFAISKFIFEKMHRQKFRELVEKKYANFKTVEKAQFDEERIADQRLKAEISQNYQKDFDAVIKFFSQDKRTFLMPRSLLHFTLNELVEVVMDRTSLISQDNKFSKDKIVEVVNYYRSLLSLLLHVAEDEVVELEETLVRINDLMQDGNIEESFKVVLLKEHRKISNNELIKSSRAERLSRQYLENFEGMFPSITYGSQKY